MHREWVLAALLMTLATFVTPALAEDYFTVKTAQQALFPNATDFQEHTLTFSRDEQKLIKKRAGTRQRSDTQQVWKALQDGQPIGWFIVDDVIGKHEFITYATAISPAGAVTGLEIISFRETHGGQVKEASWREQFLGKSLENTLRLGKDIDNISGATLSCRNITDGVRRLLVQWELFLRNA